MLDVDEVLIGQGLRVIGYLERRLNRSKDAARLRKDLHPFISCFNGKSLIQNGDQFLSVLSPRLNTIESWVLLQLFNADGLTDF
ncbi:MAG: hypothetical protein H6Q41_2783 [Deltaproteobacteria bacterium]|nr:hypothetical protein [Deltaproteobacteria bacterium]